MQVVQHAPVFPVQCAFMRRSRHEDILFGNCPYCVRLFAACSLTLISLSDITSGLQLGRAEVVRGLRNFLSTDKPEHHSIDRL